MFCHNCGANNPDGFRFCEKCGTQLINPAGQENERVFHAYQDFNEEDLTAGYRPEPQVHKTQDYSRQQEYARQNDNRQHGYGQQSYNQNHSYEQASDYERPSGFEKPRYEEPYRKPNPAPSKTPTYTQKSGGMDSSMIVALVACLAILGSIFMTGVYYPSIDYSLRLYDDMGGKLILLGLIPVVICVLLDIRWMALLGSILGMIDLLSMKNTVDDVLNDATAGTGLKTSDILEWREGYYIAWVALGVLLIAGIRGVNKKRQEP